MAKAAKPEKTNVHRLLDSAGIAYCALSYDVSDNQLDGVTAAKRLGLAEDSVFKTLVTQGASRSLLVFVIPVAAELDLKKAAVAAGEKSIAMLPLRELLKATGYVHGGCSPLGMKQALPTFLDESAMLFDAITFSAGKIGHQVQMQPEDLLTLAQAKYVDLCK